MKELRQMISNVGLKIVNEVVWNDSGMIYYESEYRYKKNNNLIAKYFIVPCTAEVFTKSIVKEQCLVEIIERPQFFALQNDVSWNLYLVCVMNDNEYKKIKPYEKQVFLNNEDYSRKILIKISDFTKYIPNGKVIQNSNSEEIKDPFAIWEKQLKKNGMRFCMSGYKSNNVTAFLRGENVDTVDTGSDVSKKINEMDRIYRICTLHLTEDYRPYCYGKDCSINFSGVNLLDGNNGAGKTSIFEALELIITGEIRKTEKISESIEKDCEIRLIYNYDEELTIPKDIKQEEKRRRERSWYKFRKDRKAIELNDAFHVYNFFSADQTFVATYQQRGNSITEYLSGALFGIEVRNVEENIKSYEKEFKRNHREILKHLSEVKADLEKYDEDKPASYAVLLDYLNRSYINFSGDWEIKELTSIVNELLMEIHKIERIQDIPPNGYQLKNAVTLINKKKKLTENNIEEVKNRILILEGKLEILKERLSRTKFSLEDIHDKKKQIEKMKMYKENLDIYLKAPREIHWWMYFMEKIEKDERMSHSETAFYEKYRELLHAESWEQIYSINQKCKTLQKRADELEKEMFSVKAEIGRHEEKWNSLQQTILTIKNYGRIFAQQNYFIEECPLCGNQETSLDKITEYLEKEADYRDPELEKLYVRYEKLQQRYSVVRQIKCCLKSQIKRCFFKRLPLWQVRLFGTETAHCFPLKNHHAKYMVVRA